MIAVIKEDQLPQAKGIMKKYNSILAYEALIHKGQKYYIIAKGPIAGILDIRMNLSDPAVLKEFNV